MSPFRSIALILMAAVVGSATGHAQMPAWLTLHSELTDEMTQTEQGKFSLFNPEGRLVTVDESVNLLKLDLDLAVKGPYQWGIKGQLSSSAAGSQVNAPGLDVRDLYVHGPAGPFEISAGRKIVKWSNGYAFNPAGLLDPPRDPTDPQDRLNQVRGRDLVQVDYYRGNQTLTAAYSSDGLYRALGSDTATILALRYNILWHALDFSLMMGLRPEGKDVGAFSFTYVVGDRLGLHGELAGTRGSAALLPRSIQTGQQQVLFGQDFTAPLNEDSHSLFLNYLLGMNYTFGSGINVIIEYYHTDEGLSRQDWERFFAQARYSGALVGDPRFPPVVGAYTLPELNLLQAVQTLSRAGVRRDYTLFRVAIPKIGRVEASALALINVADHSFVTVPELSFSVSSRIAAYLRATLFTGNSMSQYGNIPQGPTISLGLRTNF